MLVSGPCVIISWMNDVSVFSASTRAGCITILLRAKLIVLLRSILHAGPRRGACPPSFQCRVWQDMGHWGLAVACWGEQQQADSSRGCQNPAPGSNARVGQSSTFQGSVEYSTTQPVLIWPAEYSAPTAARLAETGIDSSASSSANPICCLVGCSGSSAAAIDKPRASSTSANQSPTTSSIPPGRRSASVCSPGEILCHSSRNVRRPVPHSHQSEPSSTCSTRPISLVVCLHAQHEVFDDLHKKGGALQGHVR